MSAIDGHSTRDSVDRKINFSDKQTAASEVRSKTTIFPILQKKRELEKPQTHA